MILLFLILQSLVFTLIVDGQEWRLSQNVDRLVNVPGVQVTTAKDQDILMFLVWRNQVVTEKWIAIHTLPKNNAHQKAVFGIH